jgi:hypothetical protein
MMPNELAFQFRRFDVGLVQFCGDLGTPVIAEQIEFLSDISLFHAVSPSFGSR